MSKVERRMSSDSEDGLSLHRQAAKRLGMCEACNANLAKYKCPRCEVRTCCLSCLNLHKRELKCNGIRDRTKYIPLVKMTKMDIMNDYYFLEECTRFVEDQKRDNKKRFTAYDKQLPAHLFRLRNAANERNISLRFLVKSFTKRHKNTTQLDFRSSTIFWRVEWCFPNGKDAITFVDEKINENIKLYEVVSKYLEPDGLDTNPGKARLEQYHAAGIKGVELLLKAEGIRQCRNRFFPLNLNDSFRENLAGKTIVEYPEIYVVLKSQLDAFNIVESDDDEMIAATGNKCTGSSSGSGAKQNISTGAIECKLDQMDIGESKSQKITPPKPGTNKWITLNFLFAEESTTFSSDTDDGAVTEEEVDMM
ncbi:box C/D snoRNA protein 1 [Anopheles darlingi]|uniref:box C/D snoRNA protein 1 n=1 Tax=Anopheles darlingi TaxID=43151 RepID=UPI0021001342|nr:box C/D snoRNA protein 1 [Anopheles darlingi]